MSERCNRLAAIGLLLAAAWAAPVHAQQCPAPLGILESLLVQGQRLEAIDTRKLLVERNGQSVNLDIGDPVCEADRLATQPDTTAKLLVGPAEGLRQELTVLPGATVILRAVNRIELLIGRLFAAVQGDFDVVMPFARLAATGTEFEVEVTPEGCSVEQLEGATNLTPAEAATARLDRLTSASCTRAAPATVSGMSPSRCQALVSNSSRIDTASRPAVRSLNAIRQFEPAEAPAIYSSAREAAICREDAAAGQDVERVLVDWDKPQQALDAQDPIARGRALLMRGQLAAAMEQFRAAFAQAGPSAAATAGFGDVERDFGLQAIRASDAARAGQHFESAGRHYLAALEQATKAGERGVILVNLGDLALLRIRLDADAAEARMTEARAYYDRARQHGDPPHARVGLARISLMRAQLIPTQQLDATDGGAWDVFRANLLLALVADQMRKPHRQDARRELTALTASMPGFAPAEELLGEVLIESGKRDEARARLKRAIAADPGNTSAYGAYARSQTGATKQLYERTYRLVEVPAVRELAVAKRDALVPEVKTVTIPPAPLTADVTGVSFSQEIRRQKITMRNRSEAPATVSAVNITGSNPNAFRLTSNGCGNAPIAAGAECSISIEFVAQGPGSYRAMLELAFVGTVRTREVKLIGEVPDAPPPPPPPLPIG